MKSSSYTTYCSAAVSSPYNEGLRWQDIKRYGINIYRRINKNNNYSVAAELGDRDPRQAIPPPPAGDQGKHRSEPYEVTQ